MENNISCILKRMAKDKYCECEEDYSVIYDEDIEAYICMNCGGRVIV